MHWKIRRDPYLRPLAEKFGEKAAYESGFFEDEDKEDAPLDDVEWRCTPAPRLLANVMKGGNNKPIVLLSTGAFNPIHDGHIEMMEHAKSAAERAGFDVIGGYLSPGHDAYLSLKCGPAAIPASVRLAQCAHKIAQEKGTGWLSVDPWEALHRRVSVNFTDVTARLRAYLRHHFDPQIDVFYVCGADNARFAYAFVLDGGCVVIGRPGAEGEGASWRAKLEDALPKGATRAKILWADGDNPLASRTIRAAKWIDERKRRLVVRIEDMRALRTLSSVAARNGEHASISPAWLKTFQEGLIDLISSHASVRTAHVDDHDATDPNGPNETLSLDAMLPAKHNLAISRLFELGGYCPLGHVARPGAPSFEEQIAKIPPGKYVLCDDDQMTGSTIDAVRARLPSEKIEIAHMRVAIDHDEDEDVVDSRDFLLGADDGGLVVQLENAIGRAPYMLPYVDPSTRASIRSDRVHAFSKSMWALNERMFRGLDLRVRDLPEASRVTFAFLGEDRLLDDVCRWHLERILG